MRQSTGEKNAPSGGRSKGQGDTHHRQRPMMVVCLVLSGASLISITCILAANIVGRTLLAQPVLGAVELTELIAVLLVSIAIAITEKEKGNVTIDLIVSRFPGRFKFFLDFCTRLVGAAAIIFLTLGVLKKAFEDFAKGEVTEVWSVPLWMAEAVVMLGCAGCCVFAGLNALKTLSKLKSLKGKE
jgi:TRAP-type C4-dicarboxylate transport system permease small subunit